MPNSICPSNLCTGCGGCVAICPKKCVTLRPNLQGHLLPQIDEKICVNCNLCRKICPVNTPVPLNDPTACYAAWAKDETDRTTSSSGGASSVFATHFIEKGGVVYGAALEDNKIQHIRVATKSELSRLKGSKYVYSYAAAAYPQIKQDLKDSKQVLFIGTPCQNAAVYNIMGNNPNLTLVNLICHGVPSMQMLQDHLKSKNITQIKRIQFRHNNNMYKFSCNDYNAFDKLFPDVYMTLFLNGITYRSSCYQCSYAQTKRIGDITIGDFWGLGRESSFEGGDLTKGSSCIIVNTGKGKALLYACTDKLKLFKRKYEEALAGNGQLRAPCPYTRDVKRFNELYPRYSFRRAALYSSAPILMIGQVKLLVKKYASKQMQQYFINLYKYFKKKD